MKFILNTSFSPHFCAFFDEKNKLLASTHWEIPKEDGQRIWHFIKEQLTPDSQLTFIGGVSGPGSFASLRAGGAILNSLAFRFKQPIHQARADKVIMDYLTSLNKAQTPFVLNSFGDRIFKIENEQLIATTLKSPDLNTKQATITAWLPKDKADIFTAPLHVDSLGPLETILETLEKTDAHPLFVPDYEYPAVQN